MQGGFDFADVIEEVMETALGSAATADDVISARRSIHKLLIQWSASQFNTWRIKTQDMIISSVMAPVPLPATVDDVLVAKTVRNGDTETPITRMSESQYAALTDKSIPGLPTQFVLHRTEPPAMSFYPVGRAGGETIRVTYIARPADFDRNANGVDAPARWLNALIQGAAMDLVRKRPERFVTAQGYSTAEQRYTSIKEAYEEALGLALTNDRQRVNYRMRF